MDLITQASTLLLAVFTGVYVFLTYRVLRETKEARITAFQSQMLVDVERESKMYFLVIQNTGVSPAQDISICITPPLKSDTFGTPFGEIRYQGLGPSQERRYFVDTTADFWKVEQARQYKVTVTWSCLVSGKREWEHTIDMNTFYNTSARQPLN